jgi:alpha-2-macroglobulin
MVHALRSLAVLLILLSGAARAAELRPFAREDMASDAVRLTETLRVGTAAIGGRVKGRSPQQLLAAAARDVAGSNFADAETLAGAAITAAPKDPANWLAYAGIAAAADDAKANDRYQMVTQGASAAYAAYQHSTTPDAQAAALAVLADLLARHEQWRPALDALKASLDRHDSVDVRKTYEAMRAEHGFRILDYKVDNESALPRVCFNFSEALARRIDFSPYVAVSGSSETAISNEDQQICVEGLKHGERYAIVLRQGLPSAVGESLLTSADYDIYVRDRSPQAHFSGRAYVLPRQGQKGAPLVTVNTAKVSIDVYRVGDRNLLATVNRDDFLKPIDSSRAEEIASQDGAKVWSGTMDVASQLNQDVVTDFPVLDAAGKLEPGIYVVTARPWKGATSPTVPDADGAMDGGLRSWPDRNLRRRRGSRARAVFGLGRAGSRRRTEACRAQQRSAGLEDHRRRRPGRFRSGPLAGQGGLGARSPGRHARWRLQLPEPRSERVRSQRPRRRRSRTRDRA